MTKSGLTSFPQPRNVLFIIIDQLRADCIFGDLADHIELPNLRNLMNDSVTFTQHYSVASPCGPARASVLTGQYAMNHRSVRNGAPLRHDIPNIATEMRKAGYLPLLFGYTDTAQDPRAWPDGDPALTTYEYPMVGFHEVTEMRFEMSYPWQSHLLKNGYSFDDYRDIYKPVSPCGGAPELNDPALYSAEHSDTAFLTNSFLNNMPAYRNENWFAHLTYIRPHPPLVAPAPYHNMYDANSLPLPTRLETVAEECALHPFFEPGIRKNCLSSMVQGFPDLAPTDNNILALRATYSGLISEVDHHIRRVVTFLKDSGQYDNTMIIVTSDHGEMLGDRHIWGKETVYNAAYHTPLIIRIPDNEAHRGEQVSKPTESIDIAPTILDWIGREIPNSMDGHSLLPLLQGILPDGWRNYTFSELDFSEPLAPTVWQQALGTTASNSSLAILRDARFTLVEFAADLPPLLFDAKGKGEMENVAGKQAFQSDLNRLSRQMLRHRMTNADHTLSMTTITSKGAVSTKRHIQDEARQNIRQ